VKELESGKLFPATQRARDVRDRLLARARALGVTIVMGARVTNVLPHAQGWSIERAGASPIEANAVIMATGGLSVPSTGSDGGGLGIVERLGHAIHATYPALTAIYSGPASPFANLAGITLDARVDATSAARAAHARGGFLFTHRGYSGPAVLDVSHIVTRSSTPASARLVVRWGTRDEAELDAALRADGTRTVGAALRGDLPERLARALATLADIDAATPLANLRREDRRRLVEMLVRCELPWAGHAGYKSAEVTGGGVSLAEMHPRTMESRRHRGLFLCGEMLDAFGPIGGYNFYWAWATGRAAGIAAAASR
jgi:predicted Rossmann fold flavoprotein